MIVDIKMEERIPQTWTLTEPRDKKNITETSQTAT